MRLEYEYNNFYKEGGCCNYMGKDIAEALCRRFYESYKKCKEPLEDPVAISNLFDKVVKPKWERRIAAYNASDIVGKRNRKIYAKYAVEIAQAKFAVDSFCDWLIEDGEDTLDNLLSYLKIEKDTKKTSDKHRRKQIGRLTQFL